MKITKVEFIDQTEDGIFCDITYKHKAGLFFKEKEVTRMAILRSYGKNSFELYPQWCDDGTSIYTSTLKSLIKLSVDINIVHVDAQSRGEAKKKQRDNS